MSKLMWDQTGEKLYETGVEKVVLFVQKSGTYGNGVAWNGVTNVTDKPTGAEATALYANDTKYLNLISNEELEASIQAYMYPDEFKECNGEASIAAGVVIGQQKRSTFGLCYKTLVGNDSDGTDYGYKLHFIYGATAAPSERAYNTVNDSPEAAEMSWEIKTTPVPVTGGKPTASVTIDSTKVNAEKLAALEKIIYGDDDAEARLPLPDEIATIMKTEG